MALLTRARYHISIIIIVIIIIIIVSSIRLVVPSAVSLAFVLILYLSLVYRQL